MGLYVEAADALKLKFFIEFMDTGLYDYELVIDYELILSQSAGTL